MPCFHPGLELDFILWNRRLRCQCWYLAFFNATGELGGGVESWSWGKGSFPIASSYWNILLLNGWDTNLMQEMDRNEEIEISHFHAENPEIWCWSCPLEEITTWTCASATPSHTAPPPGRELIWDMNDNKKSDQESKFFIASLVSGQERTKNMSALG